MPSIPYWFMPTYFGSAACMCMFRLDGLYTMTWNAKVNRNPDTTRSA